MMARFVCGPHKPSSYLRHCLGVEYDPHAKCPEYDRAVREIFSAAENPDEMVRHWNELAGYLIQSRREHSARYNSARSWR
jgi:putative DNA primase/helicase